MTTLSKEQLTVIDDFLTKKYAIKQSDVKDEIIDHMACEIEFLLDQDDQLLFLNALKITLLKWNFQLKPHLFVGYKNVPRFMGKSWVKTDVFIIILTYIIAQASNFIITTYYNQQDLESTWANLFYLLIISALTLSGYGFFKFRRSYSLRAELMSNYLGFIGILSLILFLFILKVGYINYLFFCALYVFIPALLWFYQGITMTKKVHYAKIN